MFRVTEIEYICGERISHLSGFLESYVVMRVSRVGYIVEVHYRLIGGVKDSRSMNCICVCVFVFLDYVYFEASSTSPYHIRRIEELNKVRTDALGTRLKCRFSLVTFVMHIFQTPNGNVEAKVMCFFRRRDLPSSLVMLADKHQQGKRTQRVFALSMPAQTLYPNLISRRLRRRSERYRTRTVGIKLFGERVNPETETSTEASRTVPVSASGNRTCHPNQRKVFRNLAQ